MDFSSQLLLAVGGELSQLPPVYGNVLLAHILHSLLTLSQYNIRWALYSIFIMYPPNYVFSCACSGPPSSKCRPRCSFSSHLVSPSLCFFCTSAASVSSPATAATTRARASGHRIYSTLQERHSKTKLQYIYMNYLIWCLAPFGQIS